MFNKFKKKMTKKNEEILDDENTPVSEDKKSKKKDKKEKKLNGDSPGGAKLFAESDDWDTPAPQEKKEPVGFKVTLKIHF